MLHRFEDVNKCGITYFFHCGKFIVTTLDINKQCKTAQTSVTGSYIIRQYEVKSFDTDTSANIHQQLTTVTKPLNYFYYYYYYICEGNQHVSMMKYCKF